MSTRTGRTMSRDYCHGCKAGIKLGNPSSSWKWNTRLTLTEDQWDQLLLGAADLDEVSMEAGEWPTAVEVIDWLEVSSRERVA